jgi:hypothetical protein
MGKRKKNRGSAVARETEKTVSHRLRWRFRFRPALLIFVGTLLVCTMLGMKAVDTTIWAFNADRYVQTTWTPTEESRGVGSQAHVSVVFGYLPDGTRLGFVTTLVDATPRVVQDTSVAVVIGQPMPVWYWRDAPTVSYQAWDSYRSDAALVAARPALPTRLEAVGWVAVTLAALVGGMWWMVWVGRRFTRDAGDPTLSWRAF